MLRPTYHASELREVAACYEWQTLSSEDGYTYLAGILKDDASIFCILEIIDIHEATGDELERPFGACWRKYDACEVGDTWEAYDRYIEEGPTWGSYPDGWASKQEALENLIGAIYV